MNTTIVPITYIERKPDSSKYRIVGKDVTVEFLSLFIDDPDWPVERIAEQYNLTPAEIYAAWSFYYDHQAEIDSHLVSAQHGLSEADFAKQTTLHARYREKTGRDAQLD